MVKTHCDACNRNFKNEEALEMHNRSKHTSPEKEKKPIPTKKIRNWSIGIIIIGLIIVLIGWMMTSAIGGSNSCKTDPVTEINIGGHQNLALHIHPNLQIIIDGEPQLIPANIGVGQGLMRPIHTHDSSGQIHVEGPCKRDFTVGEFFQIWGGTFNSQCILENCVSDKGTLTMTVNGNANSDFENYEVKDGDNIVITYTSN